MLACSGSFPASTGSNSTRGLTIMWDWHARQVLGDDGTWSPKTSPQLCQLRLAADGRLASRTRGSHCRLLLAVSSGPSTGTMHPGPPVASSLCLNYTCMHREHMQMSVRLYVRVAAACLVPESDSLNELTHASSDPKPSAPLVAHMGAKQLEADSNTS